MQYFGYFLVLIHGLLFLWAAGGMMELLFTKVPWASYTNTDFPQWLLPIHWGSVLIASTGFLLGYLSRWNKTPELMLSAYTMLFTICVIETFGFMTSQTRYVAMTTELIVYSIILVLLFNHPYFISRFA